MKARLAIAALLGAATVAGFAPLEWFPLPLVTLALLFRLWRGSATPAQALSIGFAWGLGFFLCGVSWVYVSLHDVGGMAWSIAALATLLFCGYLALFPATAGYAYARLRRAASTDALHNSLLLAGLWTLTEWLRGSLLTGFPWLSLGYSQTPPSPLAGFAPLIGSYGIGFLAALLAAVATCGARRRYIGTVIVAVLVVGGFLRQVSWTSPVGAPVKVSLLQGNIPQSLKWDPARLALSIDTYERLAATHPAQLTVLPETAIPLFLDQVPAQTLRRLAGHGDVLLGVALRLDGGSYANGAVALAQEDSALPDAGLQALRTGSGQVYAKSHLVPFGEFIPPGFVWFFDLVRIPMSDFTAGPPRQKPLRLAGQEIMPNICYEDLFGEEIIRGLPAATLLVNLSNTAWFGHSLAQPQHLQIARMRAMETGRPMLRATNTGMTAAIDPDGRVRQALPAFTADALTLDVQGYGGTTPFVLTGNAAALLLVLGALMPMLRRAMASRRHANQN